MQLATGDGFDLALFVEVMVKASTQGHPDHPGLTAVEKYMGVPKWREIAAASLVVQKFKARAARAEINFRRSCSRNLRVLQKHNMLLSSQLKAANIQPADVPDISLQSKAKKLVRVMPPYQRRSLADLPVRPYRTR